MELMEKSWDGRLGMDGKQSDIQYRIDVIEGTSVSVSDNLDKINKEVTALQRQIESLEWKNTASDAVFFGIPQFPKENLKSLFHQFILSIDVRQPVLKDIFRTKTKYTLVQGNTIVLREEHCASITGYLSKK